MSGRLIILPKKSYCPWNPDNVERLLRDERKHAEEEERETALRNQDESLSRLQTLRERQGLSVEEPLHVKQERSQSEHVNLFAAEEEESQKRVEDAVSGKASKKNVGIMPLYLGQSAQKNSFYLQAGSLSPHDRQCRTDAKDNRLKNRMDPMKEFFPSSQKTATVDNHDYEYRSHSLDVMKPQKRHRRRSSSGTPDSSSSDGETSSSSSDDSDSRRRRRRRSSRSSRRKGKSSTSSTKRARREKYHKTKENAEMNSIGDLRRRRMEREWKERQRQDGLIGGNHCNGRKYQDQYFPSLSRR